MLSGGKVLEWLALAVTLSVDRTEGNEGTDTTSRDWVSKALPLSTKPDSPKAEKMAEVMKFLQLRSRWVAWH